MIEKYRIPSITMTALIVDFPQEHEVPTPTEVMNDADPSSSSRRSSPKKVTAPPRRVFFTEEIDMKYIEDLTIEHSEDLWFDEYEIRNFKYQTALMLRTIKASNMSMAQYAELHCDESSAFMGLESYLTETTTQEIRYQRRRIKDAVLHEQRRQCEAGVYDADALANVSKAASDWSRKRSVIIALLHADKR